MSRLLQRLLRVIGLAGVLAVLAAAGAPAGAASGAPAAPAPRAGAQAACEQGTQTSGAIYRICMPPAAAWNGDLVVFAHGFVPPHAPITIPEDQLVVGGVSIPDTVTGLGYAFAVTSYSKNGLAVREGLTELVDLVSVFSGAHQKPRQVYLIGVSMGGLITTLAAEQYPQVFSGAAALCAVNGSLRAQVDYLGDFRVVFDYFFPGLMPGTAAAIPQTLIDGWDTHFQTVIQPELLKPSSAVSLTQLLAVTGAPVDPNDQGTVITTVYSALWYNVFATNDALQVLGGQPFDNLTRVYKGSADDERLNTLVQRFKASPAALATLATSLYEPSGRPRVPLVTMHTTLDPTVPAFHAQLYRAKVEVTGSTARHDHIPVARYGHCAFNVIEAQEALTLLVNRVASPPPFKALLPLVRVES